VLEERSQQVFICVLERRKFGCLRELVLLQQVTRWYCFGEIPRTLLPHEDNER
jgi:hypothetical protein